MSSGRRAAARRRHPSSLWLPDHERLRRALAARLADEGHPRPLLGATVLALRGVLGAAHGELAEALGVSRDVIVDAEHGVALLDQEDGQIGRFDG